MEKLPLPAAIRKGLTEARQTTHAIVAIREGQQCACALGLALIGVHGWRETVDARDAHALLDQDFPETIQPATAAFREETEYWCRMNGVEIPGGCARTTLAAWIVTLNDSLRWSAEDIAKLIERHYPSVPA